MKAKHAASSAPRPERTLAAVLLLTMAQGTRPASERSMESTPVNGRTAHSAANRDSYAATQLAEITGSKEDWLIAARAGLEAIERGHDGWEVLAEVLHHATRADSHGIAALVLELGRKRGPNPPDFYLEAAASGEARGCRG